ncbi:restriction endonuclease subunit S [Helicobacter pylori]|uniref:restriction endonuclease subunit S n=1 Tax=Helicobacter pylori TaxID=210 RepID=UPI000EAF822D|nr:restriction endonuclease subunit S [Helicobacter pylori]
MIGPLSSQLNAIKWGEFRLGDLFEASNGDFDIQKRHINHRGEFVITAGLSNNGVLGQSDIKAKVFESHTITIDMFGCAFYRSFPYKMVTHARVFSLKPQFEINHKIGLFLSTLFFGYPKKFGYENMCSWAKIKNDKVILPLKPTAKTQTLEDIDFNFMENFIAELEQCRLAELEAYLKAAGLENTTLSSNEENALNVFNNSMGGNTPCGLTWQSFRLGDLFEIVGTKSLDSNAIDFTDTGINFVGRTFSNNGIQGKTPTKAFKPNKPFTITATVIGQYKYVKFQTEPYYCSQNINKLTPKIIIHQWNAKIAYYFITHIQKFVSLYDGQQSGYKLDDIKNHTISLPTNPHGKIDFHFMHTLINALMKQTIQGVAQYCDAKIQATKEVISQETPIQKDSLF